MNESSELFSHSHRSTIPPYRPKVFINTHKAPSYSIFTVSLVEEVKDAYLVGLLVNLVVFLCLAQLVLIIQMIL